MPHAVLADLCQLLSRQPHRNRQNDQRSRPNERTPGSGHRQLAVRHRRFVRRQQQCHAHDGRHGARVEHALDGIDRDLQRDGKIAAARDQVGPGQIGNTAKQRHRGESDHLRTQQIERRQPSRRPQEDDPAIRTDQVRCVDQQHADENVRPAHVVRLLREDVPPEVSAVASVDQKRDEHQRGGEREQELLRFQCGIAPDWMGFTVVWEVAFGAMGINCLRRAMPSKRPA